MTTSSHNKNILKNNHPGIVAVVAAAEGQGSVQQLGNWGMTATNGETDIQVWPSDTKNFLEV